MKKILFVCHGNARAFLAAMLKCKQPDIADFCRIKLSIRRIDAKYAALLVHRIVIRLYSLIIILIFVLLHRLCTHQTV